jgi:hypothetical protein
MYAMQYEISLPSDYDMAIIRHRVATKGPMLDGFPGLALKAYLIRERGVADSPVNQYAPFYLWASIEGMSRFLWGGGGFRGILDSFGRPAVEHWTGVALRRGPARHATPQSATRIVETIPADVDPAGVVERELRDLKRRAEVDGVHSVAIAIDPKGWQLVRFTLWKHPVRDASGTRYEVLHVSCPHLDEILDTPLAT